jgi:hypothetical protein
MSTIIERAFVNRVLNDLSATPFWAAEFGGEISTRMPCLRHHSVSWFTLISVPFHSAPLSKDMGHQV